MESSSRAHHRWILGRYVQLVSLLQLIVYVLAASELIVPFAVFTVGSAVPLLVALPLWRAPDYGDRSATSG